MSFLWPQYLWLMLALPLLPALYLWLLRRRSKPALRYSSLAVVRAAAAANWRRHVPPRCSCWPAPGCCLPRRGPLARVPLPWARSSIMLAMDVSLSMRVTDVKPTRLAAAQEAAKIVPARSAEEHRSRARHVRRQHPGRPAGDPGSRVAGRGHRRLPDADRHGRRQRHRAERGGAVSGPRHRRGRHDLRPGKRRRAAGTTRTRARQADHAGGAGLLRLGRDHPAERRPPHHRRRHAGSGEDGRRSRRAHLRGRAWGRSMATPPGPRAWPSTCSWTSRPCARWRA